MAVSIKRVFVLLVLIFGLAIYGELQAAGPLAKGSRIAVISNFSDHALFQRVGATVEENISFYHRIPTLNMNTLLTTTVVRDLQKNKRFHLLPIYHEADNKLLNVDVSKKNRVTPPFKSYISRLIAGKHIDTVVLIVPGQIDFGDSRRSGEIWLVSGYGLFNRVFKYIQTNTVFSAYKIYVINVHTYRVLAFSKGSFKKRVYDIEMTWDHPNQGISSALKIINKTIRKEIPKRLVKE